MNTAFANLTELIAPQLAAVEKRFDQELASTIPTITALVKHVSRFRGKMLRPSLVFLAGQAVGKLTGEHVTVATVLEMIHMATLIHDDVLDEAELRRRGATINHLRGNEAAVLLGDYLFTHAFHLCGQLDSPLASRIIGQSTNIVCEGELLQLDHRNDWKLDEPTYLDIIGRKTARLTAVCCHMGAFFSGGRPEHTRSLEEFGQWIGVAFQIQDDILDITGDTAVVGKTLGTDIEKGKMTLPLIHFMRTAPREHRELLRSLLCSREGDRAERIRNLVIPSRSISYAQDRARQHIRKAKAVLGELPPSDSRSAMEQLAEMVLARES